MIFLDARARGEQAVLVLETRNSALTTKYRTEATLTGAPATTRTIRKNPARARRSQLRLEAFREKKLQESTRNEHPQTLDRSNAAGISSSATKKLVLKLVEV